MDITKYRNIFPHVTAPIQMSNTNGKVPVRGDMIKYIHTNSEHQNQLSRVVTARDSSNNSDVDYDKEKYKDMLLNVIETVLGIFCFDRTLYGKAKDKKWWMELKRNAIYDMKAEVDTR
jgi:DNA polymerase elongation subunit (family B)